MYQEVRFKRRTEAGGEKRGPLARPPIHFMLDTGLKIGEFFYHVQS